MFCILLHPLSISSTSSEEHHASIQPVPFGSRSRLFGTDSCSEPWTPLPRDSHLPSSNAVCFPPVHVNKPHRSASPRSNPALRTSCLAAASSVRDTLTLTGAPRHCILHVTSSPSRTIPSPPFHPAPTDHEVGKRVFCLGHQCTLVHSGELARWGDLTEWVVPSQL